MPPKVINNPHAEDAAPKATEGKKETPPDEFDLFDLVDKPTWKADEHFFGVIELSKNGGLHEIKHIAKVDLAKYFGMLSFVVMGSLNIIKMILGNIQILQGHAKPLPTKIFLSANLTGNSPRMAVAAFELVGIAFFIVQIVRGLVVIARGLPAESAGAREVAKAKFARWIEVAKILHSHLPILKSFSSMRVVQYVIPSVLLPNFKAIRMQKKKKSAWKKFQAFSWFAMVHICFALFGFEAFLVKFSEASLFLADNGHLGNALLKMALFLNQMMGVVELNTFLRKRLFFFIFAGPDNVMDKSERRRMAVWEAGFQMKAYEHFEGNFLKFFTYSLTFNDGTFQELSLAEEECGKKK